MKKILINNEPWLIRAAVIEDKKLAEIQFQAKGDLELERSFFKGKIQRILPGIQTAFVEIGHKKAGFLHITEVDKNLSYELLDDQIIDGPDVEEEEVVQEPKKEPKIASSIEKIFTEGQEILVQVIKEPINEKGAKLSTCFTIPGKFSVLMPNIPHIGVSRKIEDKEERARLKTIATSTIGQDMGTIIRTTAEGRSEEDIRQDLNFLITTWTEIKSKYDAAKVGEKIYQDLPLQLRVIRENLDEHTTEVICDKVEDFNLTRTFLKRFMPDQVEKVVLFKETNPIFDHFSVEQQIEQLLEKKVLLKSGGSLIIETTEAMTVIDVNTGKFVGKTKLEDTVFKTNMEAADEIVRQLRLRNIGGIIVIDFIDMSNFGNKNRLSKSLEKTLKEKDKLKSVALRVSEFGIVQMTRKRSGKTLIQQLSQPCCNCQTKGFVKSAKTVSYQVLRSVKKELLNSRCIKAEVKVSEEVFNYLTSDMQASLIDLEKEINTKIILELAENFDEAKFSIKKLQNR